MNTRTRSASTLSAVAATTWRAGLLAGLMTGAAMTALAQPATAPAAAPAKAATTAATTAATAAATAAATTAGGLTVGSVVTTSSGLIFKLTKLGSGPSPSATDTVKVHYRGTFMDGKEFDSSYARGEPASFPLNQVIKCWSEGVQRLQVGGAAKLTCPPAIAYGERGAGGGKIPANATLQFDVELLGINGR